MRNNKNTIGAVVWNTVKDHMLLSAVLLAAVAGTVVTGVLPPLVLERIVDRLAGREALALELIVWYFLMLVIAGLFDAAKEVLITIFGQKVTHNVRSALCAKLSHLPAAYYTKNEPGATVSRFVNDVDTVEALFTSGIISMVVDACKVISIVAVIFTKSRGLGFLLLAVTPLLFGLTRMFQKRMLKSQIANRVAVGKVNNHIPETIQNIRMIHTFYKEKYMEKRYDKLIGESYRYVEKSNFYDAVYSPIIVTVSAVIVAIMMVLSARGGQMQLFFGMSVGTAVAVINYVGKVFEPLENIGMEIQNIQSAVAGIARIQEFLREEERPEAERMPEAESTMLHRSKESGAVTNRDFAVKSEKTAVEFSDVTFGYESGTEILHQYSFSIEQGENVTLTGRTGAGKSTIFKLLLGLYEPWEGSVRIFGMDASGITDEQKRKVFGYVEQTFRMIPGTVLEQITLKDGSIPAEDARRAIRMVGMEDAVRSLEQGYDTPCTPQLFSQGQMQLLSIARAIVADPAILLLDEITANLDSATEGQVLTALRTASENRTVISISHRLYEQGGSRKINLA